ncbi:ferredoxin--NADP reductase [Paraburkholderia sp. HP33-1]|uniref:ferredoxin--NADP reductase n=1 Tax=Paraburkholderia sp. HP33-1 TaxID=2883243 RepID=UPI001F1D65EF|nr:ferredoxin--NADP reductase [Paraburkholderia sp. HP33-1]
MTVEASQFHTLRVSAVIDETDDAKSIVFARPDDAARFDYRPGQFLTLRIPGDGGEVMRCYSLASSPALGEAMKVTVKRVKGGVASNWICDNLRAGDDVQVLPPVGAFTPRQLDGDFLLFAGGSGVTPVMSILKLALHEGTGRVVLVYANRDERSVIFAQELRTLASQYAGRLVVYHWLESVQGLPRVDLLTALARPYASFEAFICGPEPYMDCALAALASLGVTKKRVHVERFVSLASAPQDTPRQPIAQASGEPDSKLEVSLNGATCTVDWARDETLLDAMLGARLAAPHSCREGRCGACVCKVIDGKVSMLGNFLLDDNDLAEGYVLACQAVPDTSVVRISFDG